ncbi:MAG: DUF2127 domain-containing protein [Bryobacteraceae bacterium]
MASSAGTRRRPTPLAVDERSSKVGLRTVATFEATKGVLVLLLGLGVLSLLHKDVETSAWELLEHLHINPDHRLSQAFLNAASRMTDARLWGIAAAAAAYAAVRFTEAWGLWNRRVWAEWFALLSGCLYLPWELTKVMERTSVLHVGLLLVNLAIVFYMLYIRMAAMRAKVE